MSKIIFGSLATLAIVGVAYHYVSPAQQGDLDIPPVQASLAPDDAISELQHLSYTSFLHQVGSSEPGDDALRSSTVKSADDQITYQLSEAGQPLVIIRAKVSPASDGKSLVDISAEIPKNSFSTSSDLHPYDLKILASMADLAASEYIDSVLNRKKMANNREMEGVLRDRYGFDENEWGAFAKRVSLAADHAAGRDRRDPSVVPADVDYGNNESRRLSDQAAVERANEDARRAAEQAAEPSVKP